MNILKLFVLALFLVGFCENIFSDEIQGAKDVYIGDGYETYTLKLSQKLKDNVNVVLSTSVSGTAMFWDPTAKKYVYGSFVMPLKKDNDTFTFNVLWIKEASKVQLIAQQSINIPIDAKAEINIKTRDAGITGPSSVIIGQTAVFSADILRNQKDLEYTPKWEFDGNIFDKVDEQILSNKYELKLKAKAVANTTNVGLQITEDLWGVGKWIVRKGNKAVSVTVPYELAGTPKLVCSNEKFTLSLKGTDKTPGATIKWAGDGPFKLISGINSTEAQFQAQEIGKFGNIRVEVTYNGQPYYLATGNLWAGKPLSEYSEKVYTLTEREQLILQAGKFSGDYPKGNCQWEVVSGKHEIISKKDETLTIKSTAKASESDKIVVRATIANECGTTSVLHTINVPSLPGCDFNSPVDLGICKYMDYGTLSDKKRDSHIYENFLGYGFNEIYYKFKVEDENTLIQINAEFSHSVDDQYYGELFLYDSNRNLIEKGKTSLYPKLLKGEYYVIAKAIKEDTQISMYISYQPQGRTIERAIDLGTFSNDFVVSDSKNTALPIYDYFGTPGGPSPVGRAVYYRFTLEKPMYLKADNVGSFISIAHSFLRPSGGGVVDHLSSSYLFAGDYIWDVGTGDIEQNDLIFGYLNPGTYYIISAGDDHRSNKNCINCNGLITTTLRGSLSPLPEMILSSRDGNCLKSSYSLGNIGTGAFSKTYTVDTSQPWYYNLFSYTNGIGAYDVTNYVNPSRANEAYFTFNVSSPTDIIVHTAGSDVKGTMIHLVQYNGSYETYKSPSLLLTLRDSDGTITPNNLGNELLPTQASGIFPNLAPGKYYLIVEGDYVNKESPINGKISVTVETPASFYSMKNSILKQSVDVDAISNRDIQINVNPNPATSHAFVSILGGIGTNNNGSYEIVSITTGTLVKQGKFASDNFNIDISTFHQGVYLLRVKIDGKYYNSKIVKK